MANTIKVRIFEDPNNKGEYIISPPVIVVEKNDKIDFKCIGTQAEITFTDNNVGGAKKFSLKSNNSRKLTVKDTAPSNGVRTYDVHCTTKKIKARGNSSPIMIMD